MESTKIFFNKLISENIKFIDFRFTDLLGKLHHITYRITNLHQDDLEIGIRFDGSSIPGWDSIYQSDILMKPDLSTLFIDPFYSEPTAVLICEIRDSNTSKNYELDPRSIALKAENYLKQSGIAEKSYFGPELEFFIFDSIQYQSQPTSSYFLLNSEEMETNLKNDQYDNNFKHQVSVKSGCMPTPPLDSLHNLRSDIILECEKVGLKLLQHYHETAGAQCKIGFQYDSLTQSADNVQKFKYTVRSVAASYGKTATFMPKPVYGDNGSCMHIHQSLWTKNKPLFYTKGTYADASELCIYYIGGIIKHAKALNAFTNSSTNSYKRLAHGYEAPVLMAYSMHNRLAGIRIPYTTSPNAKRVEARFPDSISNAYLAFSAIMMAGLDGIINKIDPQDPCDHDLSLLTESDINKIPHVACSLREALMSLGQDRDFLKVGGVFTDELINAYIMLKMEEVKLFEKSPHPAEFSMYYNM